VFKKYLAKLSFKVILKELLITLVLIAVVSNIVSYLRKPNVQTSALTAQTFTLLDGSKYTSSNNTGPLMVHFWATWCPVCKTEEGNIARVSQYYNVVSVAVKSGSDSEVKTFLKENEITFNTMNDRKGTLSYKYDVNVFPTTFIYDKKGELVFSEVGYTSTLGLFIRMWWAGL